MRRVSRIPSLLELHLLPTHDGRRAGLRGRIGARSVMALRSPYGSETRRFFAHRPYMYQCRSDAPFRALRTRTDGPTSASVK